MSRRGILFLCVENAARSQMAEGLAGALAPAGVEVASAGSAPRAVHPLAVEVMGEIGVDISHHHSKSIESIDASRFDTVITLCADEVCPVLPGAARRLHWPLPDAAAAPGSDAERRQAFRSVRDQLRARITQLLGELYP